jgi:4'-phosphopantetheinyl transferase
VDRLDLPPDEVQVWQADLRDFASGDFLPLLDPDERTRHARLVIPEVAERFAISRGLLRQLLARHLGVTPEAVSFSYGAHGKPEVAGLHFNLSHSVHRLAVALSARAPVGLDIEAISHRLHARQIASRYFSPSECARLATDDEDEFFTRFYRLWTAKEAVMKVTGLGFALPLSQIEIGLDPLALLRLNGAGRTDWTLHAVDPAPGFAGTLACAGGRIVHRQCTPGPSDRSNGKWHRTREVGTPKIRTPGKG